MSRLVNLLVGSITRAAGAMVVGQPQILGHLLELLGVDLRHPGLPALAVGDVVGLGVLAGGRRTVVAAHLAALGRAVAQYCAAVDETGQGLPGDAGVVGRLSAAASSVASPSEKM